MRALINDPMMKAKPATIPITSKAMLSADCCSPGETFEFGGAAAGVGVADTVFENDAVADIVFENDAVADVEVEGDSGV